MAGKHSHSPSKETAGTPARKSATTSTMAKRLPAHKVPSLEMLDLPEVSFDEKPDNITMSGKWWLIGGHVLVLVALTIIAAEWHGALSLVPLAIAAYCYWNYQLIHNTRLKNRIARLNEQVEQLSDKTWELREGEERYRSLVEAFGDSIMHRNAEGFITFANEPFAGIFDKMPKDMIGTKFEPQILMPDDNFPPPEQQGVVHEVCIESIRGTRWYSWLDVPIRDASSGLPAIRSIIRDVTQHKETELALRLASEKAETASRAKSRFLANVSHEMRTPLNGILGMSDLLDDTKLSPDQTTYNEAIHTSGSALLTLIEDILDITRIEANKFEMRRDEVNLAQQVEHAAELLSVRAHAKGIGLSTYISAEIPDRVNVDSGRLRQILINLLGNAVKFTEQGEVCLRVILAEKMSPDDSEQALIRFEVEDTGPGISSEDKQRIFDEFVQVDDENTRQHGGAGLGLAISQAIVGEMGGKISIESDGKMGTIFSFELDLEVQPAQKSKTKTLKGCKISIISGSKLETAALTRIIKDAGGRATSTKTSNCILVDAATTKNPVRALAKAESDSRETLHSVILLTPEMRKDLQSYLDKGFDAYLIKPVRRDSLLKILEHDTKIRTGKSQKKPSRKQTAKPEPRDDATRILLAEDNDINALLAKSVLEKDGHFVCHVTNGQLAVTEFHKSVLMGKPFDLILMDLHMPVMDGLDAISRIAKHEKEHGFVPVRKIILSADEQSETRLQAENAGADDYLSKPFKPARLMEIARECSVTGPKAQRAAK